MKAFWNALALRERWLLALATLVVLITLGYVLVLEPLHKAARRIEQQRPALQANLDWMQQAASRIRGLQAQQKKQHKSPQGALFGRLDRSAQRYGVKQALKRLSPVNDDEVRVTLEGVAFDRFLPWWAALVREEGVVAERLQISRSPQQGKVRVQATFRRH